jgi:Ecdysteroid kinase-like family
MPHQIPHTAHDLTPEFLSGIISKTARGTAVTGVNVVKAHEYGDGDVSTSARASLRLDYVGDLADSLPRDVVVKLSFDSRDSSKDVWFCQLHGLFNNEVNFYNRIRPMLNIEAPRSLGGLFDPDTRQYVLIMEDVSKRGATFPTMMDDVTVGQVQTILDTLARLHAQLWNSPRFGTDLAWIETHLSGGVEEHMRSIIPQGVQGQLEKHKFKRELLARLGVTERQLFEGKCANKRHQSKLPQTLLHGDTHIGNTYRLRDGTAGLHDWQLCVRGFVMHDVTYLINTALAVDLRRQHDRDLLEFYRERLIAYGVTDAPDDEMLWLEHRRATLWSLYIGWLTCPAESYGWDVLSVALLRVSTAFEDYETRKLVMGT